MTDSVRVRFAKWLGGRSLVRSLGSVTAVVDDSPGWGSLSNMPHDYDPGKVLELYQDALTAWRKNPLAWRIIAITTDYIVGDAIRLGSPVRRFAKFINDFWHHDKNRMDLRLEGMSDELSQGRGYFRGFVSKRTGWNELHSLRYQGSNTEDRDGG